MRPLATERRHPRLPVEAPAYVADGHGTRRAKVVDVSVGGASLVVDEWIASSAEVRLFVGASKAVSSGLPEIRAQVRWVQPSRKGLSRIGVSFRGLTREAEGRLLSLWLNSPSR